MTMRDIKKDLSVGGAGWMDTYADMVTLLLTFFVFLFAFSNVDQERLNDFLSSYSGAPFVIYSALDSGMSSFPAVRSWSDGVEGEGDGEGGGYAHGVDGEVISPEQSQINTKFNGMYGDIVDHIALNGLEDSMNAQRIGDTILIRFSDAMLFDSGSAQLKPVAIDTIVRVRTLLFEQQDVYAYVHIEGHTDNVPISTNQYPDNWYLSQDRAQAVLHKIIEDDTIPFDLAKFNASGKSEYHPIASNDTPQGRAQNRRVDIVIGRRNLE